MEVLSGKAPELRHRALKAGEQRRGEDVLAFQGYGELQRRQLPAKDLQRAVLPVGDPVFTDALARVQVELQLAIPTLVDGTGRGSPPPGLGATRECPSRITVTHQDIKHDML